MKSKKGKKNNKAKNNISEKKETKILNNKRKRIKNSNKNEPSKTKTKSQNKVENLSTNIKMIENENELLKIKNIHFSKCIVEDATDYGITSEFEINLFEIFKSIDNIPYLVYINKDNKIVFFDLNNNKKKLLKLKMLMKR